MMYERGQFPVSKIKFNQANQHLGHLIILLFAIMGVWVQAMMSVNLMVPLFLMFLLCMALSIKAWLSTIVLEARATLLREEADELIDMAMESALGNENRGEACARVFGLRHIVR